MKNLILSLITLLLFNSCSDDNAPVQKCKCINGEVFYKTENTTGKIHLTQNPESNQEEIWIYTNSDISFLVCNENFIKEHPISEGISVKFSGDVYNFCPDDNTFIIGISQKIVLTSIEILE